MSTQDPTSTEIQDPKAPGAPTPDDELEAVRRELEAAQAKVNESRDLHLRATAELDNFRKRAERDMAAARKYGVEKIASELLDVRDNLERGLDAAKAQGQEASAVADGMDLTLKQLVGVMERYGVTQLDPKGEPFNPEWHQAMSTLEKADVAPNTVVEVMQKGYRLHDRLLRPALVIVSKAPAAGTAPEDPPPGMP
jgi:molecular chaperone GrpE